ncbi:MAG: sulfatase-like hydrolase/transferase [Pseudomonadota bacterium]
MSDEHRADAMGCVGHPFVNTPNLDALAARGTVFADAYTPCPICVPARACFATGHHVHQIGCWDNAMPYIGQPESWGHILQRGGVQVESIGKLHYRDVADDVGFDQEHIPMMVKDGVGMVWASIRREDERITPKNRMLGDYIGPGESDYTRYDTAVVDRAIQWFSDKAAGENDRDWCLYIGFVAPHFPLVCPEPFFSKYRAMDLPEPKLLPSEGFVQHPWIEKQNAFMNSEAKFKSPEERKDAIAAYWALCEWLDHNIGRVLAGLNASGLQADIIYSSDHGDNVGARGLWGKSNMYHESVSVPMIATLSDMPQGMCETPVSLLDVAEAIPHHFDLNWAGDRPGRALQDIAAANTDLDREIVAQYHAAGAVSGAYMLRAGRWKYVDYIGFAPELFDIKEDPEETTNLAYVRPKIVEQMKTRLARHVDTDAANQAAFDAQDKLIAQFGGLEGAKNFGAKGATPVPKKLLD